MSLENAKAAPLVLVCDDSEDVRHLFVLILEQAGARVLTAGDGPEAVASAKRESPDLIILDIDLPTMDGIRAMELIRAANYAGPIVAVTGGGDEHTALLLARGFTDVIQKPMPLTRLRDVFRRHLSGSQAG